MCFMVTFIEKLKTNKIFPVSWFQKEYLYLSCSEKGKILLAVDELHSTFD